MRRILIHILANAAAILVASKLISGFVFHGSWLDLAVAAAILGIVNSLIRPMVKLFTFPVILLTLGLFSIIINITMLFVVAHILPTLAIHGFWAGFWGVVVISLVNHIILSIFKEKEE